MAYTIKGLAKANDAETFDENGLAQVWEYWYTCNVSGKQVVRDFLSLRKKDRNIMKWYLYGYNPQLLYHIIMNINL